MGNDGKLGTDIQSGLISIHVPAWGTTDVSCTEYDCCSISIHVPAWGTTAIQDVYLDNFGISIHVPAWGTTEVCYKGVIN